MTATGDARLLELIAPQTVAFWGTLGITVEAAHDVGHVSLGLKMRPELGTRRPEVMHGGAISTLIDSAAGGAVSTLRREGIVAPQVGFRDRYSLVDGLPDLLPHLAAVHRVMPGMALRREGDDTWAGQATTDLNVTYLNAATTDIVAEARVLRSGRTIAYVQVDVRDAEGTLVAVGRATYLILRR